MLYLNFSTEKKPISKRIPLSEFAKVISNRSPSQEEDNGLLFKTVNNEVRVFIEYYLTFEHISFLKYLCIVVLLYNLKFHCL